MIERNKKVEDALVTLLESNVGYNVDLFCFLTLRHLEDGTFAVSRHEYDEAHPSQLRFMYEEIFEDARKAVEFFEEKRREYELGYDFEREGFEREIDID